VQAQVVPSAARAAEWADNDSGCHNTVLETSCALCAANQGNSTLRVCKHTCRRIAAACGRSKNMNEVQLCHEAIALLAAAQLSNATGTSVAVQIVEDDGDTMQGGDGTCLGVDHVELWPSPGSLMSRARAVNVDGREELAPVNYSHAPDALRLASSSRRRAFRV
jgi:hypothetical protein